MFRKSFAFILLGVLTGVATYAQTPVPPRPERAPQAFAWSFDGGGSYLGVETADVTKETAGKLGLRDVRGVSVEKVMDGSPAQNAGLQSGDVILKFNGEEVTSVRKLTRLIGEVAPDHQARISVSRNGSERELNVTLGKRPTPTFEPGSFGPLMPGQSGKIEFPPMGPMSPVSPMGEMPAMPAIPPGGDRDGDFYVFRSGSTRQIGVGVTPLTKQLAQHFGVEAGAMINNVRENSPAAKSGLKAGDIIVEADGKPVKGDFDLIRTIGEKKDGSINLTIVRDGSRQSISVTPEEVKGGMNTFFETPEAPDTPAAPGSFKFALPAPATPMPLNQMMFPGRVI